jgi:histidine triad (HIT) family protein
LSGAPPFAYAPRVPERDPSYDGACMFCRIAAEEIPSDRVHEDDRVIVFRDINPRAPTHLLAISRRHIRSADDLTNSDEDRELLSALFGALRMVASRAGLRGYRIVTNVGPDAGQSVFHLHFHLLGGRPMLWPPG